MSRSNPCDTISLEEATISRPIGQDTVFQWLNIVAPQTRGQDKYSRTLADVFLLDGNQILIKDGWCWFYRKYAPGDAVLEGLEQGGTRG